MRVGHGMVHFKITKKVKWKIEEVVKWNIEQRYLAGIRGISEDADRERSIFWGHVTLQQLS
jgi:hypothetical protein